MSSLKKQLKNKLANRSKHLEKCYKILDDCNYGNKRYALLSITSIIIEVGMCNAFKHTNITKTEAICKLYDDGVLNPLYRNFTSAVRSVRNNLVHINNTDGTDTEVLASIIESKDEKYFKSALNDLFGKDIKFNDKYLSKMYNMLADILDVDTLSLDLLW